MSIASKPPLRGRLWLFVERLSTVAVLASAFVLLWTIIINKQQSPLYPNHTQIEDVQGANIQVRGLGEAVLGTKALVALIEFSDFECPYCGHYSREVFPELRRDFIETGKIRYAVRNLPLDGHPHARKAAEAADCALQQNRYWQMHERLFLHQAALSEADLVQHANAVGLDVNQFSACLSAASTSERVNGDIQEASRLELHGTPIFLLGRVDGSGALKVLKRINGTLPYESLKAVIEAVLRG